MKEEISYRQSLTIKQQNTFEKKLLAIKMNKTIVKMNKPVYLELSILYLSKIPIYDYWYDYVKPKHGRKAKIYYNPRQNIWNKME